MADVQFHSRKFKLPDELHNLEKAGSNFRENCGQDVQVLLIVLKK